MEHIYSLYVFLVYFMISSCLEQSFPKAKKIKGVIFWRQKGEDTANNVMGKIWKQVLAQKKRQLSALSQSLIAAIMQLVFAT